MELRRTFHIVIERKEKIDTFNLWLAIKSFGHIDQVYTTIRSDGATKDTIVIIETDIFRFWKAIKAARDYCHVMNFCATFEVNAWEF